MDATPEITLSAQPEVSVTAARRRVFPLPRKWFFAGLIGVTLLGGALRWSFLDHPMRYDESLNYYQFTSRSPGYILTHYNPGNHVLHTIMVRVSTELFGRTPFGLRFPVFVGGTLLIPVTALLAWVLFRDRWTALLAALAVAGSAQLVEYSANARGYAWLALMTTLATIVLQTALRRPERMRRWFAWGAIAGLGAYTMPLMIYPMAGMSLAGAVIAWRRGLGYARGRATLRGLVLGGVVCGAATIALYAPILFTMGPAEVWGIREMTLKVWGPRVGGFTNQLGLVWEAWTQGGGILWQAVLVVGTLAYIVRTLRRPTPARLLPLLLLIGAAVAVRVHDAPLRSRAWMFAMPIFLTCAIAGVSGLWRRAAIAGQWRVAAPLAICAVTAIGFSTMRAVAGKEYLCSEPNVQVNVAEIIDECRAYGVDRCALVMRYTPAANFYRDLWEVPAPQPTDAPQTARVYIVADHLDAVGDLWNAASPGFAHFAPVRVHRQLSHGTLYIADRTD